MTLHEIIDDMQKIVLTPFLFLVALGSRVFYDYMLKNKKPTTKQLMAHIVLGCFVMTMTYFILKDYGVNQNRINWVVMGMGFVNHTALTWVLENWSKIVGKFTGIKVKEDEKED